MTVDSLWTVLLEANCGVAVNACKLRQECKRVAIDLSIWICEAMSSSALLQNHKNPSLSLVYQRTVKLLKMGIIPVAVIEGTSTTSKSKTKTTAKKRTCGNLFRQACRDCQRLLAELGVIVLSAIGEGEALCALLNQKGLVDGVITNDGDIFLYGGVSVYTNFSIDNLQKGLVLRYHAPNLRAIQYDEKDNANVSSDEESLADSNNFNDDDDDQPLTFFPSYKSTSSVETIPLDQDDLIAFAFLSGSDIFGEGMPFVGYKKAIRFIQGTKKRSGASTCCFAAGTTSSETTTTISSCGSSSSLSSSLQVLKMWVEEVKEEGQRNNNTFTKCSICLHRGDRRSHERQGCNECGTKGHCIAAASDERFRQSLKRKVQSYRDRFLLLDELIAHYKTSEGNTNALAAAADLENQILQCHYSIRRNISTLLTKNASNLIVYGRSRPSSRDYMWQSLSKLFARLHLLYVSETTMDRNNDNEDDSMFQLSPTKVVQHLTHETIDCYKVMWTYKDLPSETSSSSFTTMEWKSLVDTQYPNLVQEFYAEKRRAEQLRAKENREILFYGRRRNCQPIEGNKRLSKRVFRVGLGPSKHFAKMHSYQKPEDFIALMRFASHSPFCNVKVTNSTLDAVNENKKVVINSNINEDDASPFIICKPSFYTKCTTKSECIFTITPVAKKGALCTTPVKKKRREALKETDQRIQCENSLENYDLVYYTVDSKLSTPLKLKQREPLKEIDGLCRNYDNSKNFNTDTAVTDRLRKEEIYTTPIQIKNGEKLKENIYRQNINYYSDSKINTPIHKPKKKELLADICGQNMNYRNSKTSNHYDRGLETAYPSKVEETRSEKVFITLGRNRTGEQPRETGGEAIADKDSSEENNNQGFYCDADSKISEHGRFKKKEVKKDIDEGDQNHDHIEVSEPAISVIYKREETCEKLRKHNIFDTSLLGWRREGVQNHVEGNTSTASLTTSNRERSEQKILELGTETVVWMNMGVPIVMSPIRTSKRS
jgi:hypothetical protein